MSPATVAEPTRLRRASGAAGALSSAQPSLAQPSTGQLSSAQLLLCSALLCSALLSSAQLSSAQRRCAAAALSLRTATKTDPTMRAAPAKVVAESSSPRRSAPSATATIGLTYWWVTTCEMGALRSSEHLPGGGDERVGRETHSPGDERAVRPRDRRAEHERQPDRRGAASSAGDDHECEPGQPGEHAQPGCRRDPVTHERAQRDHLQRHGTGDHRSDAGVDPRLGDGDDADAGHEERGADRGRCGKLRACDPDARSLQREHRREDRAGGGEAQAGRQQRRQSAYRHLDREVSRAPDQVDGEESGPELPGGRSHTPSNVIPAPRILAA